MKLLHLFSVVMVSAACVASALPQDEAEGRALPRGLLKRGLLAKGKQTTTTTTSAPQEDLEYEDDAEYPAEADGAREPSTEAAPSSTEGKKLVAGGVRPFRSNTDLLETLKRRRAQAAEAKQHGSTSTSTNAVQQEATEAPAKSSYNKKRVSATRESNNEDSSVLTKPSRNRFARPVSRAVQTEPESEEQVAESAPQARTGRTFSRRGGN